MKLSVLIIRSLNIFSIGILGTPIYVKNHSLGFINRFLKHVASSRQFKSFQKLKVLEINNYQSNHEKVFIEFSKQV